MLIRRLEPSDRKDSFDCGDPQLDEFLVRYAGQNQFVLHSGVTYVAIDDVTRVVLGYLTVAAGHIMREELPTAPPLAYPAYPLPVVRLARLAVDNRVHGMGIGTALLRFGLELAVVQAGQVGCVGVVVDAKQQAVAFYERFGFSSVATVIGASAARPRLTMLFLPVHSIRAAVDHGSE